MVRSYGLDAKLAIGVVAGLSSALTYLHNPAIGMVYVSLLEKSWGFFWGVFAWFTWLHVSSHARRAPYLYDAWVCCLFGGRVWRIAHWLSLQFGGVADARLGSRAFPHLSLNVFRHLDIKPENILLGENDEPKLCDFDTAMKIGSTPSTMRGTPEYAAPESMPSSSEYWALRESTDDGGFPIHPALVLVWPAA